MHNTQKHDLQTSLLSQSLEVLLYQLLIVFSCVEKDNSEKQVKVSRTILSATLSAFHQIALSKLKKQMQCFSALSLSNIILSKCNFNLLSF